MAKKKKKKGRKKPPVRSPVPPPGRFIQKKGYDRAKVRREAQTELGDT